MVDNNLIWVLLDDRAGNRSQALGVARALMLPYTEIDISYNSLIRLPNIFLGETLIGLNSSSRKKLTAPWPKLVISAGRRSAPAALAIKKMANDKPLLVHIMQPGLKHYKFDLIATPAHDNPPLGHNIIPIIGAPHGLSEDVIRQAKKSWMPSLDKLPAPRIAVFFGGSTRRRKFTEEMAREFGEHVSKMAIRAGGSLMVSTSRRSGSESECFIDAIRCPSHIYRWNDEGENPYLGFLACADGIVVSGDSISMCSEACALPVPVQIFAPSDLITPKHARCHKNLYDAGYALPFSGVLQDHKHPVLNSSLIIAETIKETLLK